MWRRWKRASESKRIRTGTRRQGEIETQETNGNNRNLKRNRYEMQDGLTREHEMLRICLEPFRIWEKHINLNALLTISCLLRKIGDVGKSLISLCKNSCKLFNEHDALPAPLLQVCFLFFKKASVMAVQLRLNKFGRNSIDKSRQYGEYQLLLWCLCSTYIYLQFTIYGFMFSGIYHSCNAPAFLWVKMAGGGRCHEFFGHSEFAIHVRIRSNRNPSIKLTRMCGSTLRSCQSGTKSGQWWTVIHGPNGPAFRQQMSHCFLPSFCLMCLKASKA